MEKNLEKGQEEFESFIKEIKVNQDILKDEITIEEYEIDPKLTDYENKVNEKWKNYEKNKDSTIMLIGSTGCGKSSLINNILGTEVAEVSYTESITRDFKVYTGKEYSVPLNLIDSRGYELKDKVDDYFQNLKAEVKNLDKNGINVDLVWYCISLGKRRIEDFDLKLLNKVISENLFKSGVCIVITQCDHDTEEGETFKKLEKVLIKEFTLPIFQVSNDPEIQADRGKLIRWSIKEIGDIELIEKFMNKEKAELLWKKIEVEDSLKKYIAMAAGVGAAPIPFSDAALLIPIQLSMITEITGIYGIRNIATFTKGGVVDLIISNLGKSIATNLIKLIPGAGSLIGGAINTAVASSITYSIGKATSEICFINCKKVLNGEEVEIFDIFNSELFQTFMERFLKESKKNKYNEGE